MEQICACYYFVQMRRHSIAHPAGYFGTSHAGRVDLELMRTFVAEARPGIAEIGLHPGALARDDRTAKSLDGWHDPLAEMRPAESTLLISPELVELLATQQVSLGRLGDLAARQNYGTNRSRSSGVGRRQVSFLPNQR